MKPKIAFITICLFYTVSVIAQDWDYPYTQFTKNDGLPSNTIYCITSDKNGILWMGTDAGVVRYDGNSFKVYNTDNGLPSNDVFEIVCDSKNRLWLTTFKNDITYILNEKVYSKYNDNILRQIENTNPFPRIYEDMERNLWIRTVPLKIIKISKEGEITKFSNNFEIKAGCNISELNGKIYFVSSFCTISYDKVTKIFTRIIPTESAFINGLFLKDDKCYFINNKNEVSVLDTSFLSRGYFKSLSLNWNLPLKNSRLWLVSQKGFKVYPIDNFKNPQIFLNKYSTSFFHSDKYENIWFATLNTGLFKLNSNFAQNSNLNSSSNSFTSIFVNDKFIVIGNNFGDVYYLDRLTRKIVDRLSIKYNSMTSFRILKIIEFRKKFVIATDRGVIESSVGSKKIVKLNLYHASIKNVILKKDSIVVLDNDGIRFNTYPQCRQVDSLLIFKRFYSYCDYKDKKVVGSQDSLYYIDKTFKPYPLNIHFNYRAVDLVVKDSILIATTAEKGVFFIHDSVVVKNFNSSNGFSSNTCYKSVIYKDELFTATNRGINIYNFKTDSLFHLYESDGLPSNTVFDLKIFNDTIYAATEAGLSIIPVSEIPHTRTFPLFANPIIVHKDTVWNLPKHVEVYTDQQITFVLNALSYGTKTPVKYHYKIVGLDTNYKSTTDQNLLVSNLSYGQYWLDAFAINTEGVRSEQLMISITIKPYFYQTRTFKTILTCFLLIVLAIFTKWVVNKSRRKEKRKNALEKKLLGFELNAWKTAINPHFLFNSLNAIQSLFQHNDLTRVNTYIKKFSSVLRKTIDQSALLLVSIHEEINYLQIYLELEKIKRGKDFDYQITCESNTLATNMIPSLVIQNIVENSLKHGIQDNKYGNVQIHFKKQKNRIHCTIQDNGAGFQEGEPIKEESKGLQLVKNKLSLVEKLINDKIKFSFTNRLNDAHQIIGAETTFIFPIITLDYELQSDNH